MSKSNIENVAPGAPWEKSGNTSWVQCAACREWFHVGPSILNRPEVTLHCPHCGSDFKQADAPRIMKAG